MIFANIQQILQVLQENSIDYLNNKAKEGYSSAIFALSRTKSPKTVRFLLTLLNDDDYYYLRPQLVKALGIIRSPEVVHPLLTLLNKLNNTSDFYLLSEVLLELGNIGSPDAVQPLLALLNNPAYSHWHCSIISTLCSIGSPQAVQLFLISLDSHPNPDLWAHITFQALGKTKSPKVINPLLLDILNNPIYSHLWNNAVAALGDIGSSDSVPLLLLLINNPIYFNIWSNISITLGRIGSTKAVPSLLALLNNPAYSNIWLDIVDALGKIGSPGAVRPLLALLNNPLYSNICCELVDTLGKIGSPDAVKPLLTLLDSSHHSSLRHNILNALGRISSPKAVKPLLALLNNPHHFNLRYDILNALGRISSPKAVRPLISLLNIPHYSNIWCDVVCSLGRIGSPDAILPLLALLSLNSTDYFSICDKTIECTLVDQVELSIKTAYKLISTDPNIITSVVNACGKIRFTEKSAHLISGVVSRLMSMLNDFDITINTAAEKSLCKIFSKNIGILCKNKEVLKLYLINLKKFSLDSLSTFVLTISKYNIKMSVALLTHQNMLLKSENSIPLTLPPDVAKVIAKFTLAINKDDHVPNMQGTLLC